MVTPELSRRTLLSTLLATTALSRTLSLTLLFAAAGNAAAAQREQAPLAVLEEGEAAEFAAIAARILPTDTTPGATEAGAIYFIDSVLGSSRVELLEPLRTGLKALQASAQATYGSAVFHTLEAGQQDSLLQAIEHTPFFANLRLLTLAGTFALPDYGGNHDYVGWDLLGFGHHQVWQPPFGYYDADYALRGE